jgi:hypothetical protein
MQLQFAAFGEDDEGLPAMAPFAMRNEGKVFNRSDVRGSGVVESLPNTKPPPVYDAPHVTQAPQQQQQAPHVAESPPQVFTQAPQNPTQAPCFLPLDKNPTWLMYALLLANGLTLLLCIIIATRKHK